MNRISIAVFLVIFLMVALVLPDPVHAVNNPIDMTKLAQTISEIRTGKTSTIRTQSAQHLAELTKESKADEISDTTLGELISLLDSPEDSVRYWVARSLGNLGKRATAAIPKLQSLLSEADCLQGDKTSASGIRFALTQIGVKPSSLVCDERPK